MTNVANTIIDPTEHHQNKRAEAMQISLKQEVESAKVNRNKIVITFDLQQTLPTPSLTVGPAFYLRKAWTYNLGVHDCVSEKASMFMWTETTVKRGSEEIAGVLKYLSSKDTTVLNKKYYEKLPIFLSFFLNSTFLIISNDSRFLSSSSSSLSELANSYPIYPNLKYSKDLMSTMLLPITVFCYEKLKCCFGCPNGPSSSKTEATHGRKLDGIKNQLRVPTTKENISTAPAGLEPLPWKSLKEGELKQRSLATATFAKQVDELFDSFNGSRASPPDGKELKCRVTEDSAHHRYWKKAFKMVKEWHFQRMTKSGSFKTRKPPSQVGWLTTLNAIRKIWAYLHSHGVNFFRPRALNQDALKNLFGAIRGGCGSGDNPAAAQFSAMPTNIAANGQTERVASGRVRFLERCLGRSRVFQTVVGLSSQARLNVLRLAVVMTVAVAATAAASVRGIDCDYSYSRNDPSPPDLSRTLPKPKTTVFGVFTYIFRLFIMDDHNSWGDKFNPLELAF
ncbi:hypothetical protein NQ317_019469 [Molorchus minor]|uniref:Transposable element P transposase-like RNase H C-terminal domain-containing protein n=1 Tax=Molorchus minor TaxID=1323400 RepID=A0ABQ9JPP9_9CUCU|nr:hypothetical protein NQ317_019469 [Molorchus minor]